MLVGCKFNNIFDIYSGDITAWYRFHTESIEI